MISFISYNNFAGNSQLICKLIYKYICWSSKENSFIIVLNLRLYFPIYVEYASNFFKIQ